MTGYFLGVDIGGTKSHALIADSTGKAIGFGQGGAGNYEAVGLDGYAATLTEITGKALKSAGLTPGQISGAGFGIAGFDWPYERAAIAQPIENLGLSCPIDIVNDTIIGLSAGSSEGWGVVIVAGTSNNCRGRDRSGREGRVTGNGLWFGEFGGAWEMVWKATGAVAHAWTQMGPQTALTEAFVEHTGARDIEEMFEGLQHQRFNLGAAAAPLVFKIARQGDPVAREVITWAAQELGKLAVGVIRQLDFTKIRFEVVLVGSMFKGRDMLLPPLQETVWATAPRAKFILSAAPPVAGGVILGMKQAGVSPKNVRENLAASIPQLYKKHD